MTIPRTETGVLLIAHGSSSDPSASAGLRACAARLAPLYADVQVGIWKESPQIPDALANTSGDALVVVPFVMSEGWFTSTIVPPMLGLDGFPERRTWTAHGRSAYYAQAMGAAAGMPRVLRSMLEDTRRTAFSDQRPEQVSAVLVGHGTPRNPRSKDSLNACVARLRETTNFASVSAAWVDDAPRVGPVSEHAATHSVVLLPFFAGAGPHVTDDIPTAVGFAFEGVDAVHRVGSSRIAYAQSVGSSAAVDALVNGVVDDARSRLGATAQT